MLLTCHREWFVTIMLLKESHWASCLLCLPQFAHEELLSMLCSGIYIHTFSFFNFFLFFFLNLLLVDLLDLNTTSEVFKQHKLSQNDQLIGVQDVISCLTTIYSGLEEKHKDMVNVPLCVDMCLNWLLNVYDR